MGGRHGIDCGLHGQGPCRRVGRGRTRGLRIKGLVERQQGRSTRDVEERPRRPVVGRAVPREPRVVEQTDLVERFGAQEMAQLTDPVAGTTINATTVARALADADAALARMPQDYQQQYGPAIKQARYLDALRARLRPNNREPNDEPACYTTTRA